MTKTEYLRETHNRTNRKIRYTFEKLFWRLRRKNIILAYLWKGLVTLLSPLLNLIGLLTLITQFFRRADFTIHYMECVIGSKRMNLGEIHHYLNEEYLRFKRYLSYGTVSKKDQQRIERVFEYLYAKHPLPRPKPTADVAHQKLTEIKSIALQTHTDVISTKKALSSVVMYTDQKLQEDVARQDLYEKAKQRQESRKRTPNFERIPNNFDSKLSAKQLEIIKETANKIEVFACDVGAEELNSIFLCLQKEPLPVKHNKLLAILLERLAEAKLISPKWQRIAGKNECFVSKNGKLINARDLSAAKSTASIIDPIKDDLIIECVEEIKRMK